MIKLLGEIFAPLLRVALDVFFQRADRPEVLEVNDAPAQPEAPRGTTADRAGLFRDLL
jgi:hypothetical protein